MSGHSQQKRVSGRSRGEAAGGGWHPIILGKKINTQKEVKLAGVHIQKTTPGSRPGSATESNIEKYNTI